MRLLAPMALAWLAIGVPIVALYIVKVRRRRQVVPTLMFWEQVFGQARPRSLWQSLRHWLSLLLQLVMAGLLALALADPVAGSASQAPKHYVLLVDQSASMQAADGEPTRFDQARGIAHRLVRSMREQDEATVLGAGQQATIVCGRTHHQPTLQRAIDGLAVTDAAGDLGAALQRARAIDAGNPQRVIAVITDGEGMANSERERRQTRRQGEEETRSNDRVQGSGFGVQKNDHSHGNGGNPQMSPMTQIPQRQGTTKSTKNAKGNDNGKITAEDAENAEKSQRNDNSHDSRRLTQMDADNNHSHDNKDTAPFDFAQDKRAEAGAHTRFAGSLPGNDAMATNSVAVAADDIKVYRCGSGAENVGILGLAVRGRADNPVELQGMVRLGNYAGNEMEAQVRLTVDGGLVDILLVKLAAGEEKVHAFRLMHTGGKVLRAELAGGDALMLDNAAETTLPAIDKKRVVLVSEGNLFLQSVLESHPWMEVSRITMEAFEGRRPEADIWVFDKFVPVELPARPSLFVDPRKDSALWTVGEELKNPLVSETDEASALLRHVHLKNCTIHRGRAIQAKQQGRMLVRSFENPLLLAWQGTDTAVYVVLAIDIGQSDLPWRTAFPILVQNVLNEFAGRSDEPAAAQAAGGESNLRLGMDLAGAEALPTGVLASVGSLPWWVVLVVLAAGLSAVEWGLHQRRRID